MCVCVCMYVCMYICMYVCISAHTHAHAYTRKHTITTTYKHNTKCLPHRAYIHMLIFACRHTINMLVYVHICAQMSVRAAGAIWFRFFAKVGARKCAATVDTNGVAPI